MSKMIFTKIAAFTLSDQLDLLAWCDHIFRPLLPTGFFLLGASTAIFGLHFDYTIRRLFLLPSLAFTLCSIYSIQSKKDTWLPDALDLCQGLTTFYQLLYLPLLLWLETPQLRDTIALSRREVSKEGTKGFRAPFTMASIAEAYRHWNNPRRLSPRTKPGQITLDISRARQDFFLRRAIKIISLQLLNHYVARRLFQSAMDNAMLYDISPEAQPFLRRLLFTDPKGGTLDPEQFAVRAAISWHWIWEVYLYLETCHAVLGIIFVVFLQFDTTEDWPPLFGNPLNAWSVKQFWGRFWHDIMTCTYAKYARQFSRAVLRTRPGSGADKAATAMGIFAISGLAHSIVSWRKCRIDPYRDVVFYLANFLVIACEIGVSRVVKSVVRTEKCDTPIVTIPLKLLGYIWVLAWFLWIVPRWEFPRIYELMIESIM